MISHCFFNCFLSNRIINHNQRKRIQLTTQYNIQIHNRICTITTKVQKPIQKIKNISCRRNCLNFIHFLSIRLPNAENHKIKYIHRLTSNIVLKIVIKCPIQTGSHLILLCISQKIHAHNRKNKIRFLIFIFWLTNKYQIGIRLHIRAETKIHRFCPEDSIWK